MDPVLGLPLKLIKDQKIVGAVPYLPIQGFKVINYGILLFHKYRTGINQLPRSLYSFFVIYLCFFIVNNKISFCFKFAIIFFSCLILLFFFAGGIV